MHSALHTLDDSKHGVHLFSQVAILSLPDRLLCNDRSVDVGLQVGDHFLHARVVFNNLLLDLFRFNTHLKDFVYDFLEILHHVVMLGLEILIRLVDDVDKDFTIVLQGLA